MCEKSPHAPFREFSLLWYPEPMTSLLWLRQDLRTRDQPALAAAASKGPVVPVYVLDDETPGSRRIGAAQRWWLHHSLQALGADLQRLGSPLVLRRGRSAEVLRQLALETGASEIHAVRHYEPWWRRAEREVADTTPLVLHLGNHLVEPAAVLNGAGERYRLFTPWFRRLIDMMPPGERLPPPQALDGPKAPIDSERLEDWGLLPTRPNWAMGFGAWVPGEEGARAAFADFLPKVADYETARNFPSRPGVSRLSPHIHFGEISPRTLWRHAVKAAGPAARTFLSEIAWREHGTNLLDQFNDYGDRNGRAAFDAFPWRTGPDAEVDFLAWTKGRTGYPIVDAGMRELWATGWMHNRVRMITASFLVKHLLIDWRRGERWFWDTLVDADLGANAMNWQYVAGTGVDAPVFSRIMAPLTQSAKFEAADYIRRWVPELAGLGDTAIHAPYLDGAAPSNYPAPLVSHEFARARALAAWDEARR